MAPFRDRTSWYLGLSAYWFATSFKWFILLLAILPAQVRSIVENGPNAAAKADYNAQWGMVFAIGAIWAMFGPSIFGYLTDRLGFGSGSRRRFLAIGAGMTVFALALLSQADRLWVLAVGYLLLQISDDVGTGPYAAFIPELVPQENRGRASGIMGILQNTGQLFAGLTGLALGSSALSIYAVIAVLNVVCAVITLLGTRGAEPVSSAPEIHAYRPSVADYFRGWTTPWRSRDFTWVWLTRFMVATGFYLIEPYLSNFLRDVVKTYTLFGFNLSSDPANTLAPVAALGLTIALFGAIGAFSASRFIDRIGRKRVIRTSGVIMLAVLVPFALTSQYTTLWCLAVVFGFGYGIYVSADWALVADVLPDPDSIGKDMGVWVMSLPLAQFAAGLAGRLIKVGNELGPGYGYRGIFLIAAVWFIVGTSLVSRVKGSS